MSLESSRGDGIGPFRFKLKVYLGANTEKIAPEKFDNDLDAGEVCGHIDLILSQ